MLDQFFFMFPISVAFPSFPEHTTTFSIYSGPPRGQLTGLQLATWHYSIVLYPKL